MKSLFYLGVVTMLCCLPSCSDESTSRSDTPVSRAVASKQLDIPLPPSATSVYYFDFVGGLQDLERFIRFDVDPQELDSAVDAIVSSNNKTLKRVLPYPRSPITSAYLPPPRKEFLPMGWWDPSVVTTGYYRGYSDAYALQILVDQGHSRIYIRQSD